MRAHHDSYGALRVPLFRSFLVVGSLVSMGTAAQGVAIGWEMYDRTDQALALGLVGLVEAVPMFLFTLPAGYLADIYDRRKLMMLSVAGASVTSIVLAVLSWKQAPVGWMYVALFLDSTFLRLGWPARSAILPLLVPETLFENAVKWRTTFMQITGVAGPAIGGIVVAFSVQAAYLLAAASSLAFILFLLTVRLPPAPRIQPGNMFGQIAAGLRFVWRRQVILGAMSLDLFAVLFGGAVYLLPIFARDILDLSGTGLGPEQALGWLRAAPAAGALVVALWMAHRPGIRRAGHVLLLNVAAFGLATIAFGLSTSFWLSLLALALTGAFDNVSMVVRHVVVQMSTPNQMRGRVSAVNAVFVGSSNQLGGFESGTVAHLFTPVISVVSGGVGPLLVVAAWSGLFPSLRRLGSLSSVSAEATRNRGAGPPATPAD